MDLIDLADEELPAAKAAVKRSKAAAVTARMDLEKHQQWLGHHQELYTETVKGCERHLSAKRSSRRVSRRPGSPSSF